MHEISNGYRYTISDFTNRSPNLQVGNVSVATQKFGNVCVQELIEFVHETEFKKGMENGCPKSFKGNIKIAIYYININVFLINCKLIRVITSRERRLADYILFSSAQTHTYIYIYIYCRFCRLCIINVRKNIFHLVVYRPALNFIFVKTGDMNKYFKQFITIKSCVPLS
jgi:hypothetical protein